MKQFILFTSLLAFVGCGKSEVNSTSAEPTGPRNAQRTNLGQKVPNLIMDCNIYKSNEIFYIKRDRNTYKAYTMEDGREYELTYSTLDSEIKLQNSLSVFYDDNNYQYFESDDSLELTDGIHKITVTHTTGKTSMVSWVKINPDFSVELKKNLLHLTQCTHRALE